MSDPLSEECEAKIERALDLLGIAVRDSRGWPGSADVRAILRAFAREIQEPLLYTSDKQTAAWKARALRAEESQEALAEALDIIHGYLDAALSPGAPPLTRPAIVNMRSLASVATGRAYRGAESGHE